jgi:hypothetical protein
MNSKIKIKSVEIQDIKTVAKYFVGLIEGLPTEGEETYKFHSTFESFRGVPGLKGLEIDLTGKFSREFDYEEEDYETPPSSKQTGQTVWDCKLTGFTGGGDEVEITNANEIVAAIETLINK